MELNREQQIIRAYECCHSILLGCSDCPFINDSQECADADKNVLVVLKSQEQKIKKLTEENAEVKANWQKLKDSNESNCEECRAEFAKLTEENEGLTASNKILVNNNANLEFELAHTYDSLEDAKADTVRKMQERLKKDLFYKCGDMNYTETCDARRLIDQIAKEMLDER